MRIGNDQPNAAIHKFGTADGEYDSIAYNIYIYPYIIIHMLDASYTK